MTRRRANSHAEGRSGLMAELLELRDREEPVDLHTTLAHVEHVLRGLGWWTLDPDEVSRQPTAGDESVRLVLSLDRRAAAVVEVIPFRRVISGHLALGLLQAPLARWLIVTNGWTWHIWDAEIADRIEEVAIDAEQAEQRLHLHLSRHSHITRLLDHRALEQSRVRAVVEKLKKRTLDAPTFLEDLYMDLDAAGVILSIDEIRNILSSLFSGSEHSSTSGVELCLGAAARSAAASPQPRTGEEALRWQLERGINFPGRGSGEVVWPAEATHVLTRKGCSSFIRFEPSTGEATILPGSVMRAKTGSSFPAHHQQLREKALAQGSFRREGDFLIVTADFPVETPSTAATLVSGTVANGWTSWRNRDGQDIQRPRKRLPSRRVGPSDELDLGESAPSAPNSGSDSPGF